MKIPYFDGHCDTIYRLEMTGDGIVLEKGFERAERAYFARCTHLRQNDGHVICFAAGSFPVTLSFLPSFLMRTTPLQMECGHNAIVCTIVSCGKWRRTMI